MTGKLALLYAAMVGTSAQQSQSGVKRYQVISKHINLMKIKKQFQQNEIEGEKNGRKTINDSVLEIHC